MPNVGLYSGDDSDGYTSPGALMQPDSQTDNEQAGLIARKLLKFYLFIFILFLLLTGWTLVSHFGRGIWARLPIRQRYYTFAGGLTTRIPKRWFAKDSSCDKYPVVGFPESGSLQVVVREYVPLYVDLPPAQPGEVGGVAAEYRVLENRFGGTHAVVRVEEKGLFIEYYGDTGDWLLWKELLGEASWTNDSDAIDAAPGAPRRSGGAQ